MQVGYFSDTPRIYIDVYRYFSQRFWPIAGRNAVRQVTRSCVQCFGNAPIRDAQTLVAKHQALRSSSFRT